MDNSAARIGDEHDCLITSHAAGPIIGPGCPSVLIEGMPAARAGDFCLCIGIPDTILTGSSGVFIGGQPAARKGDTTVHGGKITSGCASVEIGEIGGGTNGDLVDFVMPSEEEKARIINETIQACIMLLRNKLNLLKKNDSKTLEDFVEWFGVGDEGAKQIIIHRIERALDLFEYITHHDFEVIQNDDVRAESSAQVYSYDELQTIYLGDKFWSEEKGDKRSQINVLIHETSHFEFIGDTRDFDYGIDKCKDLAKNNPGKALYNADTFAFFLEA